MSRASKPKIRQNRHKQRLNQTIENYLRILGNAQNGSFLPFLFFVGLKMVHFARFKFSLCLKSLISAVFIFRWSHPVSVQPFSAANLVKNLRFPSSLNIFLLKSHKI